MTTEELQKKLKISKDTCIHCPTLELAKQVLSIFNQLGLRWSSEKHYITYSHWDNYRENTVYYPFEGVFFSLEFAYWTNYKIISAEEFIALHTENEKNMTIKEKIEELESRIQVLQNAIMNGEKLKPKTALKKKDEIEYYLFTDEAKRRLSRKNMNCAPFTIVEKYGNVVTTSNGDTINTYWIYCINSDTPKYTPAPPKGKCCRCNCCKK